MQLVSLEAVGSPDLFVGIDEPSMWNREFNGFQVGAALVAITPCLCSTRDEPAARLCL